MFTATLNGTRTIGIAYSWTSDQPLAYTLSRYGLGHGHPDGRRASATTDRAKSECSDTNSTEDARRPAALTMSQSFS